MENQDSNRRTPVIETFGLAKHYSGGVRALDGVDLSVPSGEFLAVMGASGSGKSTLLHLIAGLTRPTAGSVTLDGVNPAEMTDGALTRFRRRRVGLVFQSFNLIPHLTAAENVMIPLLADGIPRRRAAERVAELASLLKIEGQLGQRPDTLSGGQQQRVTLARALSMNPALLLADEPTGNLDSVSSQHLCEIFDRLCREEGRTILLVTHEPAVAVWSKRRIILRDGKILSDRPTSDFADAHHLAAVYQETIERSEETSKEETKGAKRAKGETKKEKSPVSKGGPAK